MRNGGFRNERGAAPPDEDLAVFQSRLRRLKREGCNLLVVGDAPRELFTRASASMLGDADARRWRVFGLTDATPESVRERLPLASAAPRPRSETTKIVSHPVASQRAAETADTADITEIADITETANTTETVDTVLAADTTETTATVPEVTVGDADLPEFRNELLEAIERFGARSYRPAEVRLSVDSLAPLLDRYEHGAVRRFIDAVTDEVHDWNAMAHYVLPVAYDTDRCQRLADEFDAVVELRTTAERPREQPSTDNSSRSYRAEERWHLLESDATMPWVPL